jgi:hypothetical protein
MKKSVGLIFGLFILSLVFLLNSVSAGNETNSTHRVCSGQNCITVQGPGTNECTYNYQCEGNQSNQTVCGNGIIENGEQCDCDGGGCTPAELNYQTCEGLGYGGGVLSCSAYCMFDVTNCTAGGGFCEDNEPFEFWDPNSGLWLTPSSCAEYNLVYPEDAEMRMQLCVYDCVPGASDPANNGYGGWPLEEWGCAWNSNGPNGGECYFWYIASNQTNSTCEDTDGGFNIFVRGTVSGFYFGEPYSYTDYCQNNNTLNEYYCTGSSWAMNSTNCPQGYGCRDGACKAKAKAVPMKNAVARFSPGECAGFWGWLKRLFGTC